MKIDFSFNGSELPAQEITHKQKRLPLQFPAQAGIAVIQFSIPIIDIQGYWTPDSLTPVMKLQWIISYSSAGQKGMPFMAFFNSAFRNRCAIGLTGWQDDTEFTAKVNQERQTYDITIRIALDGIHTQTALVIDRSDVDWTQAIEHWRQALALPRVKYPDAAWEPVFCSWYAVHAAVTQQWTDQNTPIAADLGFKTLIIDDGWCFDQPKRVTPQTLVDWYENIGDWNISQAKYPQFDKHRARVQALGIKYMLWVAPFLVGTKSQFNKDFPQALEGEYHEGYHRLDCLDEKAASDMMDKLVTLIRTRNLDGLKIDFLDIIPPNVDAPRGRVITRFIAELSRRIRDVRQDALVEFRQSYATPGMAQYATQFRAGDVPFDFITNFQRLAQIRITMGDGIPVHADPAYWNDNETDANISRHLIASLAGVPMLSMELTTLSQHTKDIIRHWLRFYQEHKRLLNNGKWQIRYTAGSVAFTTATVGDETIAIVLEPSAIVTALALNDSKLTYILNLSEEPLKCPFAQAYDVTGQAIGSNIAPAGGYAVIDL